MQEVVKFEAPLDGQDETCLSEGRGCVLLG